MRAFDELARCLVLGDLLSLLRERHGGWELLTHWQEGEYHHDLVLKTARGEVLVVSTNCNGGVKEVLVVDSPPTREALWEHRRGRAALGVRRSARTVHWVDPCEIVR